MAIIYSLLVTSKSWIFISNIELYNLLVRGGVQMIYRNAASAKSGIVGSGSWLNYFRFWVQVLVIQGLAVHSLQHRQVLSLQQEA